MPGGTTGRPIRALFVLGALLFGWLAGRWPLFEHEVAGAVARARAVQFAAIAPAAVVPIAPVSGVQLAALPLLAMPQKQHAAVTIASALLPPPPATSPATSLAAPGAAVLRRGQSLRSPAASERAFEAGWTLPPGPSRAVLAVAAPRRSATGHDLATAAYAALAAGDRRAAAEGFANAAVAAPNDPRAPVWAAQRRLLTRRWSGGGYVFARAAGSANPGAAPLLGGGQSGAGVAWTPYPLARRPLSATARATSANDPQNSAAEAAFGLRWKPLRGVSLSAERLVALAPGGRNDWTLRLAGSGAMHRGKFEGSAYGETGVVGIAHRTLFAAAQARAGYRLGPIRRVSAAPGAGVWTSVQHDRSTTSRVDVGPGVVMRWERAALPLDIAVDYRFRVAGNAAPGSGVAVTLSTGF